jgi:hypothetical protein
VISGHRQVACCSPDKNAKGLGTQAGSPALSILPVNGRRDDITFSKFLSIRLGQLLTENLN